MNRWIATGLAATLTVAAVVGCNSNNYDPHANSAQLSSYATNAKYPMGMGSMPAKNISYAVADNKTITLINSSETTLTGFQLWVSKSFVIEVATLPAHKTLAIAPDLIYNSGGANLTSVPKESITNVQILSGGQLMDVPGPVTLP